MIDFCSESSAASKVSHSCIVSSRHSSSSPAYDASLGPAFASISLTMSHAARASAESFPCFALAASAWHGDQEGIADLLHQRGANATWADANGATPMHQAAARGDLGGTKILLDRGGDVNAVDEHAMTPLHVACLNGHGAVAELLLTHSANVRLRERSGLTPFDLVPKRGNSALGYDKRAASIDVESLKAVTRSGAQPAADGKPAERPAAKQRKGAKA